MGLRTAELAILGAAVDRIVPRDGFPSAREAGVLVFLERLIDSEGLTPRYQNGLEAIDAHAVATWGRPFVELTPNEQDNVLAEIERTGDERSRFFALVAEQTIEGYYSDPGNGGNRDGVAWKMVGYRVTA